MDSWFAYLNQGLSRRAPKDRVAGEDGYTGLHANVKRLWPFMARHWRKGVMGALLIILSSLLLFPQPLIIRYLIDSVVLSRRVELLAGAIALLIVIVVIEKLAKVLQQFYCTRFEQVVIIEIQEDLFDRVLSSPKSFFDETQTGYLMSRLSSDVQGLRWFFSGTIVSIVTNFVRFMGGVGLLLYLEWRLAVGVLVLLPGLVLSVSYFSGKLRILSHQSMEQQANVSRRLQEMLSSASLIKAFSSERPTIGQFVSELKAAFHISLELSTVNSIANLLIDSMPALARGIVLAVGAYWVIGGDWTLGSLFAFQAYLGYVFGPVQILANSNIQLQHARASLERVAALFDIVPEENLGTGTPVERLKGDIELKNVSFSYNGRGSVLDNISFHVRPGEHVAFVGPSGVGKTTLVSLILRFYKPTSGEIYFDGRPASEYEVGSLRRRIGYVSQSPLLLSGTIMENLRYGNPEADREQVIRAATVSGIHEFIGNLPAGYETETGEKGVKLSEGQRQRLSIARALVKDPDVFVLDEPTSALDSVTEKSLFSSLPTLVQDKTLFVVAHRISTIIASDRILLLDESGLASLGTHSSLLETSDYYRSLVAYQQI